MKVDELAALPSSLTGDFRSIEPHLLAIDKHLTLRSYLDGWKFGSLDEKVWLAVANNRAATAFIKSNKAVNLTRWFTYIEQTQPEIQKELKAASAARAAKVAAGSKAGGNYGLALQDTDKGVVTRFLPEPSGYLHIGHAKAALLSDYFAHQAYKGTLRLRLDDTNPSKEKEEFQDAIIEDLKLMGIIPDKVSYTSNYFDFLYDMCIRTIKEGHAYADDTEQETMRNERMHGIASKHRDMSVEETLRIFEDMKTGSAEGIRWCIRAKISVDDNNKAMRDPVIYRCNVDTPHHRTGTTWKVYPTYDFACPVVDSHEGITHAMRSTEYTDRNPQYNWFLDTLRLRKVHMWDFARMNFVRTLLSKRKLTKLVDTGFVWSWDDPRMPTVRGIRRRGMTIEALRDFIIKQGPSRAVTNMDWTVFWAGNKKVIDPIAPRHTVVAKKDMVLVAVEGSEAPVTAFTEDRPMHPKNKEIGTKKVSFAKEAIMEQVDAASFRVGEEITMMEWGNAIVRRVGSVEGQPIKEMTVELNLKGDVKKTEKKIHWVGTQPQQLIPGELWDFDYLLTKDKLDEDDDPENFLNPNTASMEEVLCANSMEDVKKDDIVQLNRKGYYRVDKGLNDWNGEEGEKGKRLVMFAIPTGKTN